MGAESDGTAAYGAFGEGDETFLRRAGTSAQRRHTRKATQLTTALAANSQSGSAYTSTVPLPGTPTTSTTAEAPATTFSSSSYSSSDPASSDFDSPAAA